MTEGERELANVMLRQARLLRRVWSKMAGPIGNGDIWRALDDMETTLVKMLEPR